MKIAYSIDVKDTHDPYIVTAEHAVGSISATTNAGSYLVDTVTFCKPTQSFLIELASHIFSSEVPT